MVTKAQINALIETVKAIADAIREAGPRGLPEGHLYAMCMNVMSLEGWERVMNILTSPGKNGEPPLVKRLHHVLYWNGPTGVPTTPPAQVG